MSKPYKCIMLTEEDFTNLNLDATGLTMERMGKPVVPEYNIPEMRKVLSRKGIKTKNILSYNDPGHGWLKVKRSELVKLGILEEITSFSYQKGDFVYLEEDMDAATYLNALKAKHGGNIRFVFVSFYGNKSSRIRNYRYFCTDTPNEVKSSSIRNHPSFYSD